MSHTNVTEDMKILTSDIATQDLMILPEKVWLRVKAEMDANYPHGWTGLHKKQLVEKVRMFWVNSGLGNIISTVTDTPEYRLMADGKRPFLQTFATYPCLEDSKEYMRMISHCANNVHWKLHLLDLF